MGDKIRWQKAEARRKDDGRRHLEDAEEVNCSNFFVFCRRGITQGALNRFQPLSYPSRLWSAAACLKSKNARMRYSKSGSLFRATVALPNLFVLRCTTETQPPLVHREGRDCLRAGKNRLTKLSSDSTTATEYN